MADKHWEIKDTAGEVLYTGRARTKYALIEELVRQGKPMDRANLSGLNLSRLDLTDMNARNACFDGSTLCGTVLQGADFTGSTFRPIKLRKGEMQPVRFDGCLAVKAVFNRCDLTEAQFNGSRLTHVHIRHAVIDRTVFAGASMTGACLAHARGTGTDFSDCTLRNVEFPYSLLVEPNFRGSDLAHDGFSGVPEASREALFTHLPNRTHGAIVLSGLYDKETRFSDTVPAIRHDALASRGVRWATSAASLLALFAVTQVSEPVTEELARYLGGEAAAAFGGAIVLAGAVKIANHAAGDWLKDKADEVLGGVARQVRRFMHEAESRGVHRASLVCAMARGRSLAPLQMALAAKEPEARRGGFWAGVKSVFTDVGHVVVCDRRHLALALGTLALHAEHGMPLHRDLTIVRAEGAHGGQPGPHAMRFMADGRCTAVWRTAAGTDATVRYGLDGDIEDCYGTDGRKADAAALHLPQAATDRAAASECLERAMLADHGLAGFEYPRGTHQLRDGRDGSILVQHRTDRFLSNTARMPGDRSTYQPAVILPDGATMAMVNGRVLDGRNASAARAARTPAAPAPAPAMA